MEERHFARSAELRLFRKNYRGFRQLLLRIAHGTSVPMCTRRTRASYCSTVTFHTP